MSLVRHVRVGDWTALEDDWTELILGEAPLAPALEAVAAAARRREVPRVLPYVREQADMLVGNGRADDAAVLLGRTMIAGGSPGEIGKPLLAAAAAAWGEEDWWNVYTEIANLRDGVQDLRAAWKKFRRLMMLDAGRVVFHGKGWGLGRIERVDLDAGEARVKFQSGRADSFPLTTAIDIFEFLEEDDLRSLVVADPDRLAAMLKKEPLEVLRWAVGRSGGSADQKTIKRCLSLIGVEGGRFTTFWRKCRPLASASPWFGLSGPESRTTVKLLAEAEDPTVGLQREIERSRNLRSALARVRDVLAAQGADEEMKETAARALAELADDDAQPLAQRLSAWLFLRDVSGETPAALAGLLANAAAAPAPDDPSQSPALWTLFATLESSRDQERCIELLREVRGDEWLDDATRNLPHAAPGMARGLIDLLAKAGRTSELVAHYDALLARTMRNPAVLVRLAEQVERGRLEGVTLSPLRRGQTLLQLCVLLHRKTTTEAGPERARLDALLVEGDPPLLERLLADASLDDLRSLAAQIEGGVSSAVDRVFTRLAIAASPDVFKGDDRPFWEADVIWTTREGLARRSEELRVLKDEKIPANAEAIGHAASFGDLSENSEWEAALEEQRNLTTRAMQLEEELGKAELLENAPDVSDMVCPGARVRFRESNGDERTVRLLGPWDVTEDDIVSYRSPLAGGMLGRHVGDRATIRLPTGAVEVEILAIAPIDG